MWQTRTILFSFFILNTSFSILAINHWVLSENGQIKPKIDSPFHMREPNNLVAFLDQVKHNDIVQNSYKELLRQRDIMAERINYSIKYGTEILQEVKCGLDYLELESHITSTQMTNSYFKRISIPKMGNAPPQPYSEPRCGMYIHNKEGVPTYGHLDSIINRDQIKIEPETEFLNLTGGDLASPPFITNLATSLHDNNKSWKYFTLGSYYWRMKGNSKEALDCVLGALTYVPRRFRDVPLLSLGSILYRSHRWEDAEVILQAAIDHAPEIAENHFAMGLVFGMNQKLNKSLDHFVMAENLEPSFAFRTNHLKNFVLCATNLNAKIDEMHSYIDNIKKEVVSLKEMKSKIFASHEQMIGQQIPLGSRDYDNDLSTDVLQHRGQYCSTRTLAGTNEPVLICDFYSDLQIKLENAEVDIDLMERDIKSKSEAIVKQMSKDYYNQFTYKTSSSNK